MDEYGEGAVGGSVMEDLGQHPQWVKCVVVGDTGVGKTRLICSLACQRKYSLVELMQTHVPTVWAIDQYRKNFEVLKGSWRTVDGIRVSLRLWDTFGDHDKDRRFAYGRADVVLICFSVVYPRSLRSIYKHWMVEAEHYCPGVPVVVCGCQVDLRHLYNDPVFLALDKGPFFREILPKDVLLPEAGRNVAAKIGAEYCETSVLEEFGLDHVFMNVIRAALVGRRSRHFYLAVGPLKNIEPPALQEPHLPPRPAMPTVCASCLLVDVDYSSLISNSSAFVDVVFDVCGVILAAHSACLAMASDTFCDLLSVVMLGKESTETVSICNGQDCHLGETSPHSVPLNHPVFTSFVRSTLTKDGSLVPARVNVSDTVSLSAFRVVLHFLYTGTLPPLMAHWCPDVHHLAELLHMPSLVRAIANVSMDEDFLNVEVYKNVQDERCSQVKCLLLQEGLFSDIVFEVDDGTVRAHRALLTSRSDVMAGMFNNDFMEKSAKLVSFPGVVCETFQFLLEFLYTGMTSVECSATDNFSVSRCMDLIEVGNRLCQPSLVAHVEGVLVDALSCAATDGHKDLTDVVLSLLEPAQWHNADQLAGWCLWYLAVNYSQVYNQNAKLLRQLEPRNQIYLTSHRWPPTWYVKEKELYESCIVKFERHSRRSRWSTWCLPACCTGSTVFSFSPRQARGIRRDSPGSAADITNCD